MFEHVVRDEYDRIEEQSTFLRGEVNYIAKIAKKYMTQLTELYDLNMLETNHEKDLFYSTKALLATLELYGQPQRRRLLSDESPIEEKIGWVASSNPDDLNHSHYVLTAEGSKVLNGYKAAKGQPSVEKCREAWNGFVNLATIDKNEC